MSRALDWDDAQFYEEKRSQANCIIRWRGASAVDAVDDDGRGVENVGNSGDRDPGGRW